MAAKLAAVAAPEAVSVSVDTLELNRPTLAAPVMLSKLPDTPVNVSAAPAMVPVAVSAAQKTAPKASSTPVVTRRCSLRRCTAAGRSPRFPAR